MNFDKAFEEYLDIRNKLREQQGEIDKKRNELATMGRDLESIKKKFNVDRRKLVKAQDALIPVLRKEVASFPLPDEDRSAYEEGTRNVLKRTAEEEAAALDKAIPPENVSDEPVEAPVSAATLAKLEAPAGVVPSPPPDEPDKQTREAQVDPETLADGTRG